jgi:hypothetical protein
VVFVVASASGALSRVVVTDDRPLNTSVDARL